MYHLGCDDESRNCPVRAAAGECAGSNRKYMLKGCCAACSAETAEAAAQPSPGAAAATAPSATAVAAPAAESAAVVATEAESAVDAAASLEAAQPGAWSADTATPSKGSALNEGSGVSSTRAVGPMPAPGVSRSRNSLNSTRGGAKCKQ